MFGKIFKIERPVSWQLILSISISLFFCIIIFRHTGPSFDIWFAKIFWPLLRLFGVMLLSLWLSALIEAKGWSRFTAAISMPLLKLGRFSDWSATAFSSAFISGITANTMLWNAMKENKISRNEMALAVYLNAGLPSYTLHLPVTFAIIVPLAGPAGIAYMAVTLAAAVIRTFFVIVAGRLFIKHEENGSEKELRDTTNSAKSLTVSVLFKRYVKKRFYRIAIYTVPVYMLVATLQLKGIFGLLREASAGFVSTGFIPVEGISVVVFALVSEFAAGAAAAGAMLSQGVLEVRETVFALILGSIIAAPVRAIRHQLPRYMGIFEPVVGFFLLVSSQLLRIISLVLAGLLYYWSA